MSEDEARAAQDAAAEYMKRVPIGDVVISTVQTLIELGYRRTGLVHEQLGRPGPGPPCRGRR